MGALGSQTRFFWSHFFELVFGTDPAAILGGAGGRGGACLNMQILQEPGRKFNTPLDPCGVRRISKGFAPAAGPTADLWLAARWLTRMVST